MLLFFHSQRLRYLTLPSVEWGPALVKHRRLVDYVPGFVIDPWGTGTKKAPTPAFENLGYYADEVKVGRKLVNTCKGKLTVNSDTG